jgi:predicted DNA-binding WGR domain protein
MNHYPITVESQSFNHKGGTKSYHLMLIKTNDGRAVVINRWGKTGAFGEMEVKEFTSIPEALKRWQAKERDKTRNGYGPIGPTKSVVAAAPAELTKAIGLATFNKMGAKAVKHLDDGWDTAGMRELDEAKSHDGEFKHVNDTTRKARIDPAELEAERLRMAAAERARQEAAYQENSNFGRF